jgi:Mn2+/Fe2+ NRAMP family transporter
MGRFRPAVGAFAASRAPARFAVSNLVALAILATAAATLHTAQTGKSRAPFDSNARLIIFGWLATVLMAIASLAFLLSLFMVSIEGGRV